MLPHGAALTRALRPFPMFRFCHRILALVKMSGFVFSDLVRITFTFIAPEAVEETNSRISRRLWIKDSQATSVPRKPIGSMSQESLMTFETG
jgi:hypothetical protein